MLKRITVSAALAGLALTGALSACGTASQPSASTGASRPAKPPSPRHNGSPRPPIIFAVRLGHDFQPSTLRISPGQHFVVIVGSSVKASGPAVPSSCPGTTTPVDGGILTVGCTSGALYYTAQHSGTAELTATVQPDCATGSICPQWIKNATLKITIR